LRSVGAGGHAVAMSQDATRRQVVNAHTAAFRAYDMEGPVQPDITWLPVSWDEASRQGSYLMRMQPGAVTIEHEHTGFEEFLILEGTLTDSDGTVFRAGDFVSYEGGTHNSWTDDGCLIAVFEWKR
jgi:quercetin dioxygenase-like cupin family protein